MSVRAAIQKVPDAWPYYLRLAQLDRDDARGLLTTALQLDKYDAQADIELALQYEAEGNDAQAEKLLLAAFDVDRTYTSRWSLANFYLRRGDMRAFWEWARRAAAMPADDIRPLFELCWHVSTDPKTISNNMLNNNPDTVRQFLQFLLDKNMVKDAGLLGQRLLQTGDEERDRPLLLAATDRLVAEHDATGAAGLWHALIQARWVTAEPTEPNNPRFAREPLTVSFDWNLNEYPGLHSWRGSSGLETELSGEEPEECTIAEQVLVLSPGNYTMTYTNRTAGISPETGLRWQLLDAKSLRLIAESADVSSDSMTHSSLQFTVPDEAPLLRLRLAYRRALGTTRIAGTLTTQSIVMEAQPS